MPGLLGKLPAGRFHPPVSKSRRPLHSKQSTFRRSGPLPWPDVVADIDRQPAVFRGGPAAFRKYAPGLTER